MTIPEILAGVSHRTYDIPKGRWRYYQEWNESLFMHWKVPKEHLLKVLPMGLTLDEYDGECWVSLVAFSMQRIRPRALFAVRTVSDFHELNLRTYVTRDGKPGVYFISMEGEKSFSNWLSRLISGLPYVNAVMKRGSNDRSQFYESTNDFKKQHLKVEFEIGESLPIKTELDKFLTERYCLYGGTRGKLFRYDVHHQPWPLQAAKLLSLDLGYTINDFPLDTTPDLVHYSKGVSVVAWGKEALVV